MSHKLLVKLSFTCQQNAAGAFLHRAFPHLTFPHRHFPHRVFRSERFRTERFRIGRCRIVLKEKLKHALTNIQPTIYYSCPTTAGAKRCEGYASQSDKHIVVDASAL